MNFIFVTNWFYNILLIVVYSWIVLQWGIATEAWHYWIWRFSS